MPYLATWTKTDKNLIIRVKVYGPNNDFGIKSYELAEFVQGLEIDQVTSIFSLANNVGDKVKKRLPLDKSLWVEVEITSEMDRTSYGNVYLIEEVNSDELVTKVGR